MDNYNFMRQVRSDIGEDGIIYNHASIDLWEGSGDESKYRGLRAIFVDVYVNYMITGESGPIAEVDYPNDEYFRYFSCGYGLSQAYSSHKRVGNMRCAISEEEKRRVMGQNLNGCERARSYNYDSWVTHFKPVYDVRKAEYLNDANVPFVPDVDWPIDTDTEAGGWFRDPANISVTDITSTSATINWTTPEIADSNVVYTSTGTWWHWKEGGPDGGEHDAEMVTDHTITLSDLYANTFYEFKIRSTNDANDPPADVNEQVIWGYIDSFTTDPE